MKNTIHRYLKCPLVTYYTRYNLATARELSKEDYCQLLKPVTETCQVLFS